MYIQNVSLNLLKIHNMKQCIKCNEEKELSYFIKDKNLSCGYRSKCKFCLSEEQKIRRLNNIEHVKKVRKLHYDNNIEKMRLEKRVYNSKNKEAKALYDINYRIKNSEKISNYKKEWNKKMSLENIIYKIKKNLRRRVHHALKGNTKSTSTMKLIGCTPEFFKNYIESLFEPNMTWENYGEWHIDHIKPCFSFDLSKINEQNECFHYSNQRPLWKTENLKRPKSIL